MTDKRRGGRLTAFAILVSLVCGGAGCSANGYSKLLTGRRTVASAPTPTAMPGQGSSPVTLRPPEGAVRAGAVVVLQPRAEVGWRVDANPPPAGGPLAGQSIVGPNGSLALGPYGSFAVQGLTLGQAGEQIEKHLAAYLQQPRVTLTLTAQPLTPAAFQESFATDNPPASGAPAWQVAPTVPTLPPNSTRLVTLRPSAEWVGNTQPVIPGPLLAPGAEEAPLPRPVAKEIDKKEAEKKVDAAPLDFHPGVIPGHPPVPHHAAGPVLTYPPVSHPPGKVPNELHRVTLPTYVISAPDILQIDSLLGLVTQPVRGPHLVRQDGTVGVGVYGDVYVAGLTLAQAREQIAGVILPPIKRAGEERVEKIKELNKKKKPEDQDPLPPVPTLKDVTDGLFVDVLAYNSKVYYVITDRVGFGEVVERLPVTGNETVLDAISQVKGLPPEANRKQIWVARLSQDGKHESRLPVDWKGISQFGDASTNYQLLPGDRVYVQADCWRTADNWIAKVLSPFERVLGITLLGSQTVNSIRNSQTGTGLR